MENINTYRNIVDEKTKRIFENALKKTISKFDLKNIGFIGIIGSYKKEVSHDIDIIIFPSEKAKIGEFIISVSDFYDALEEELKKHHERLFISVSPRKILQEMTYYLSSIQEGTTGLIPVHSLVFFDLKSFEKFNPEDFKEEIKKTLITLYGDFNIIYRLRNDIPQKKLEPYFLILDSEINSKIKSFPRHLIRANAESLFSYLNSKYGLRISAKKNHNLKDIKNKLTMILRDLDKELYK